MVHVTPEYYKSEVPWPWVAGYRSQVQSVVGRVGMLLTLTLLVLTARLVAAATPSDRRAMEKMDAMAILRMYGWKSEQHLIQTEDGYMIKLHRIMGESNQIEDAGEIRPPVLLQHGILGASDMWILRGSDKDLPFLLAKAGYDVWLGNIRGNNYCVNHTTLNETMDSYWDYSFHEMGYYDVPAMIDHILAETGAKQVFYIGHSMGTTMFYTMCASRPEYNKKIRAMFSLAPVAFMAEFPPLLKHLARHRNEIWKMFIKQRIYKVWPRMPWLATAEANLCREGSPLLTVCLELIFAFAGRDYKQFDKTVLPIVIEHLSSTNPRTLAHFAQNVDSGRFRWFDFGPKMNLRVYGSREAPDYNLSLITAPISIHYSTNDYLSFEKDVLHLARKLPNVIGVFKVPYTQFNHLDYLWCNNVRSLLYEDILRLMDRL